MKTVWIIDGGYLFDHGRTRPFDYLKLQNELARLNGGPMHESHFLNAAHDPVAEARNPFHTWLKSAPPRGPRIRVRLYPLKNVQVQCAHCGQSFAREVQKGVDVGIATLIVKLAVQNVYERLILAAGDGDFEDAIGYVKSDLHKEVWICGSQTNLSADLQSYADRVVWLEDLHPAIDRGA